MPKQQGKRTRQEEIQEAAREAVSAMSAAGATAGETGVAMPSLGPSEAADMDAIAVAVANDVAAGEMIAGLEHAHHHGYDEPTTKRSRMGVAHPLPDANAASAIAGLGTGMEVDPTAHADLLQYAPSQAGSTKRSETWYNHFERLRAFREETGHFHLPKRDQLSQWARDQRTQKVKLDRGMASTLTAERKAALDSIGFPWRLWTKKSWNDRIAELDAFRTLNGHCDVPIRRGEPQSLATWVDEQRKLYRQKHQKGKTNALTDEREAQLDAMGFSWYRYGPTSWAERIADLEKYKAEHGGELLEVGGWSFICIL
jgi:hypothetical protein